MIPPTSIDGTDITGATIDGTDVQEITVDGDVVFSAAPTLPVAYSNLVAWWPFDSAEYGGSNEDDVTAIIGGSGDNTAYDGTINGVTYQSSAGVTDLNAGTTSGAFDFPGNNNYIEVANSGGLDGFAEITCTAWTFVENVGGNAIGGKYYDGSNRSWWFRYVNNDLNVLLATDTQNANNQATATNVGSANAWVHCAFTWSGSSNTITIYVDGQQEGTGTSSGNTVRENTADFYIGKQGPNSSLGFDGIMDDVRIYNTALTQTQIDQIYQNTEP